jgi:hypothetical protein
MEGNKFLALSVIEARMWSRRYSRMIHGEEWEFVGGFTPVMWWW